LLTTALAAWAAAVLPAVPAAVLAYQTFAAASSAGKPT
jgi:hypothetical protein